MYAHHATYEFIKGEVFTSQINFLVCNCAGRSRTDLSGLCMSQRVPPLSRAIRPHFCGSYINIWFIPAPACWLRATQDLHLCNPFDYVVSVIKIPNGEVSNVKNIYLSFTNQQYQFTPLKRPFHADYRQIHCRCSADISSYLFDPDTCRWAYYCERP